MPQVYLALGTNMGDKRQQMCDAVRMIHERVGAVTALSSFYETAPWGFQSENSFLNAVLAANTSLAPLELLQVTQQIERELGRLHKSINKVYHDRLMDVDILLYGQQIIQSETLAVPHADMHLRRFVLEPLVEIAPDVVHPVLNQSIRQLWQVCYPLT